MFKIGMKGERKKTEKKIWDWKDFEWDVTDEDY